jgi:hypothetical protein
MPVGPRIFVREIALLRHFLRVQWIKGDGDER